MDKTDSFIKRKKHPKHLQVDFRTPQYLFEWINDTYGPINYDAACEDGVNNLAPPLRLEEKWPPGSIVYSNPPYDQTSLKNWIEKGHLHAQNGGQHIILMPNKLCQVFMYKLLPKIDEIIFLGGRVNFISEHSVKKGASMTGSILIRQGVLRRLAKLPLFPFTDAKLLSQIKAESNQKNQQQLKEPRNKTSQ